MPSLLHETLGEMFREQPALAAELLSGPLGFALPDYERANLSSAELNELVPAEYRADALVTLTVGGTAIRAVVVEVQLNRNPDKRFTWPAYVVNARARHRCPVYLLVVCPDPAVAAWCAEPIEVGEPGFVLTPVVLGPDQFPVLDDAAARANPRAAMLSAIVHGGRPDERGAAFTSLLSALDTIDHDRAGLYYDLVLALLPEAAQKHLEALMTTTREYRSDFARGYYSQGQSEGRTEGRVEGRVEGRAASVLDVLDARGVTVPHDVRQRISACTDLDVLATWVRRAATVTHAEDLFLRPALNG